MAKHPQSKQPDPDPHSQPIVLPLNFWENAALALLRASVDKRLRCYPPRLIGFSLGNVRVNKMDELVGDLTVSWVPSTSAGVTVQHFAATTQIGSGPITPVTQDVGPGVTSVVIPQLPAGTVVNASVIADNGVTQSPALSGTYTVPTLAAAPAAPTALAFAMGNVQSITPPAAPAAPSTPPPTA